MDLAIVGAMDQEVEGLLQKLSSAQEAAAPFSHLPIFQGRLCGLDVVIVRCGIGKVNAALATQYTLDHFKPRLILNYGLAGSLDPTLHIGDIVAVTGSVQHDLDARGFGFDRGVIPRLGPSLIPVERRFVDLTVQTAEDTVGPDRVRSGLAATGDLFVDSQGQKDEILRFFPDAICCDMEVAAIAQVASLNGRPYMSLKVISDAADDQAGSDIYLTMDEMVARLSAVVENLLISLSAAL